MMRSGFSNFPIPKFKFYSFLEPKVSIPYGHSYGLGEIFL